jgi:hypothetical protein
MTNITPQAAEAARLADEIKRLAGVYADNYKRIWGASAGDWPDLDTAIDRLRDLASRPGRLTDNWRPLATLDVHASHAVVAKPTAAEVTGRHNFSGCYVAPSEAQKAVATLIVKREYHDNGQGPRDTEGFVVALSHAHADAEKLPLGTYTLYTHPSAGAGVPQEVAMLTYVEIEPLWHKHCHAIGPIAVQDMNFATAIQRAAAAAWGIRLKGEQA